MGNIMGTWVSQDKNPFPLATTHPTSTKTQKPSVSHIQPHSLTPKLPHTDIMGAVVSCFESICRTIGSVLTAIVNGIVSLFDIIISCLTCGRTRRSHRSRTHTTTTSRVRSLDPLHLGEESEVKPGTAVRS